MRKRLIALLSAMMVCGLTACSTEQAGAEDSSQPEDGSAAFAQVNTIVDEPGDDIADLTFMWWGSAVRGERTQAAFELYHSNNPGVTFETESVDWIHPNPGRTVIPFPILCRLTTLFWSGA